MSRKKRSKMVRILPALAIGLSLGVLAGWVKQDPPDAPGPEIDAIEHERAMVSARELSAAFRHAAGVIEPSVVHITTEQPTRRGFRAQSGVGSGVILDERGYILTNHHVVQAGRMITVRLSDGRTVQAELIGGFEETDLAVLKIDVPGLKPARFGDSEAIGVGEWVLAVGSPFGFEQTVTAGIISAKGRGHIDPRASEQRMVRFQEFLQTDAAINPGNSGGPLVDLDGRVVGINTAIASRDGSSAGLGFAIPADVAEVVMQRIIERGRVDRGWLGVTMDQLDPNVAFELGIDGGVLLDSVSPGSPADRAGLEAGDIVVSLNNRRTESITRLGNAIMLAPPGEPALVEYYRGTRRMTARPVLEDRNTANAMALGGGRLDRSGLIVVPREITISRQGMPSGVITGYLITEVLPGSPADNSGFQASDFIVDVDGRSFDTVRDFAGFVEEHPLDEPLRFSVIRGNERGAIYLRRD
ncbi:MAG: trypsin-like peptidase domain-containing protein [Phycisphaerales bacterium]|nr:trypsin-like peptidase domain-containing protein [Planctomycetota bacterium]MCH8509521.1 trypsin-like peptidase domain-containing protein [Phycisphaerales bacterium]